MLFPIESNAQSDTLQLPILQIDKQPDNSSIPGELLLGTVGSFSMGILGAYIGYNTVSHDGWFAGLGEALAGYLIGSSIGSALGVQAIGQAGRGPMGFGNTYLGSIIGSFVGIGLIAAIDDDLGTKHFVIFGLVQSAGASIGLHSTINKQSVTNDHGLLNYHQGTWSMSSPSLKVTPNPSIENDWIKSVTLVGIHI